MFDDFCKFFDMLLIMCHWLFDGFYVFHGFQWFFDCCYMCFIIFIDVSVVHIRMFVFYHFHWFFYCCRVFYMRSIIFHSLFNGPGMFFFIFVPSFCIHFSMVTVLKSFSSFCSRSSMVLICFPIFFIDFQWFSKLMQEKRPGPVSKIVDLLTAPPL
jgi:hypothetical protein